MDREECEKIFIAAGWKEGQKVLLQNRRKGRRTETSPTWNEIRNNQMRDFGPAKQVRSTVQKDIGNWVRPDPTRNRTKQT